MEVTKEEKDLTILVNHRTIINHYFDVAVKKVLMQLSDTLGRKFLVELGQFSQRESFTQRKDIILD